MERVQFQQEQMLTELKDLVRKGLFTQKEVKQIMQKRTSFETTLVRRIPKKGDFLRYIAYEMGLETLRRKRAARILDGSQPPSVSDYALVRRQFHVFERALKKFKSDVGLWIQYIQVAKKEGARTLVGRITARALQLHPNVPALYILAASHELEHLAPSAARALLQRGIRLNPESTEVWREYVKMELGFVESLRRRWDVLGIEVEDTKRKGKQRALDEDGDDDMGKEMQKMQVDAEDEGDEGEAARRQIMQGAIVKSVMSSAAKALPKIELFISLQDLLATYPCPPSLRDTLLDHLFTLLHETLPQNPTAIRLSATRHLLPGLEGEALVDALKDANERLASAVRDQNAGDERLALVYASFIQDWCRKDIDDSLVSHHSLQAFHMNLILCIHVVRTMQKGYLVTSLQLLAQRKSATLSPVLLATAIILLTTCQESLHEYLPPTSNTPERVLRLARKWTGKDSTKHSAQLWLARLDAEKQFSVGEDVKRAWDEARAAVVGEGTDTVWLWGLDPEPDWETTMDCGTGTAETEVGERIRLLEVRAYVLGIGAGADGRA
ncbi:hypothetical protein DAEQUDRAFT_724645 [Daedalea quercina L-15889]|uniref:U3 small nucleolar RNA-associated protein 6 N-terminal domain-containing protein n=1 Tax=Daedalea quercina L-15889 TaxID=1314783 RepID=A0A165RLC0_9APHY|nr:hypothetical protein DAEQUDRAFT_724645 [Daedalea quercina L-15889]